MNRSRVTKSETNECFLEDEIPFIEFLLEQGFDKGTLRNYKQTTKRLGKFMSDNSQKSYSSIIGVAFLEEAEKSGLYTTGTLKMMKCVVRRFSDYKSYGKIIFKLPRISRECPNQFAEGLANYLESQRLKGLKESTIENKRYNIQKALLKFDEAGIRNYAEIKPETIYKVFEKTSDKAGFYTPLRGFLSYLFSTGDIPFDYSSIVPSVRKTRPVPSVYTTNEVEKFLNCCDTSTYSGKRDMAIILLALRLGVRSSDIANLRITDIDLDNKEIRFIQKKTGIPQRLELLPEIEESLLSYMSSSRPDSEIPNIFLTIRSPIRAIGITTVYDIVRHYFNKSGIDIGQRKRGGHALRMTFSSELVAEKIPYEAVRKLLGHENPNAVKHYVKFDIDSLRSCAIKVPPISGKLAEYMNLKKRLGGEAQ